MKRDWDLVRKILLDLEEVKSGNERQRHDRVA